MRSCAQPILLIIPPAVDQPPTELRINEGEVGREWATQELLYWAVDEGISGSSPDRSGKYSGSCRCSAPARRTIRPTLIRSRVPDVRQVHLGPFRQVRVHRLFGQYIQIR